MVKIDTVLIVLVVHQLISNNINIKMEINVKINAKVIMYINIILMKN